MARKVIPFICLFGGFICPSVVWTYENVALNKTTWQKHPYITNLYPAALAVDGRKSYLSPEGGECAVSSYGREAEWRVDLGEILSLHHICVQYAMDDPVLDKDNSQTRSFLGFSVYLSNTTEKKDGILCFKDTNYTRSTIPNPANITCPYHGRYVIYYNNRTHPPFPAGYSEYAYADLCEVEVYGCPTPGYFGPNCSSKCPRNCQEGHCDVLEGTCLGCIAGYTGDLCDEKCKPFKYGVECNRSCGNCSDRKQCNHVNGHCPSGCDVGSQGDKCDIACASGWYGKNCRNKCGIHCKSCNRFDGRCEFGCHPGWKGQSCKKACDGGNFGHNCNESCGMCLGKQQCHHSNGTCLNGCESGYQGINCTEECTVGSSGQDCQGNCSKTCRISGQCDKVSGQCEGGCHVGWSQPNCDAKLPKNKGQHKMKIIGVLIPITAAIIGIVSFIIFKKIQMKTKVEFGQVNSESTRRDESVNLNTNTVVVNGDTFDLAINSQETSLSSATNSECVDNLVTRKQFLNSCNEIDTDNGAVPDISIVEIPNFIMEIKNWKENEESFLRRNYSMLPCGEQYPCYAGKSNENLFKNRYKTILPFDHSRVHMREEYDTSDYINANYIKDINGEKSYIATQGPTKKTLHSFWAMICQENISQIVMLTELTENGKIKCSQYWPTFLNERIYGSYVIKNIEEYQYAFYTIRKLSVTNRKRSHVVTQFHYTMWPDHGTPDPLCLVVFHSHVLRTRGDNDKSPCVVHCSAGIGRTGTYIALDALYKEGKMTGKINVMEYCKVMRSCRMNMVQTYEQYKIIFLALAEEFKASVETRSLTDFMEKTDEFDENNQINQTTIQKEFEDLLKIIPEYTNDDYKDARQYALNKDTALPLDKFLLYLTSSVKNRGSFINAIYVSSYVQNNAFIVTHYPTPEDAVDFLRLLIDHESDTVICMDPLADIESSKAWLPERSSSTAVSSFRVECTGQSETDVKMNNNSIINEKGHKHHVVIVEPQKPMQSSGNFQNTLSIRSLVSYAIEISTGKPITIVSKDGALLCGLFCAVFNSVQQIRMDGNVDVFTTVRQLQTRRPEFCSTLEEYMIVHRALRDYIGTMSEKVYYNQ